MDNELLTIVEATLLMIGVMFAGYDMHNYVTKKRLGDILRFSFDIGIVIMAAIVLAVETSQNAL